MKTASPVVVVMPLTSEGMLKPPVRRKRKLKSGARRPVIAILEPAYKSKLEQRVAEQILGAGLEVEYETIKLEYDVPSRTAKYKPDFPLSNGIIIEAKGRFRTAAERQKMILVRDQNPDCDIRFVFQKASLPIYKGSKTTHGDWATRHGFQWADEGIIPQQWLEKK